MKLLALGHSSYLLEMTPPGGSEAVRILADPWLEDYLIGDLLGRFPRVRLDLAALQPIHGVYLSHSHTDHLCPYSLVKLWRTLEPRPCLILPGSLLFLEGLLRKMLEGVDLRFLAERQEIDFHGLRVTGFFNPETAATNEDDVMLLMVKNGRETFLAEADALLPFYHPRGRELVTSLLLEGDPETICFLTTKNEGAMSMAMIAARNLAERESRYDRALEDFEDELNDLYAPVLEEDEVEDLWQCPRLVRLIGGQGIRFPQDLGTDWNRVLFPLRITDRVGFEQDMAGAYECQHRIEEFRPGFMHTLGAGTLESVERIESMELLDEENDRVFDPRLELFEDFPAAPLVDTSRDTALQAEKILACLNERFLPHLIGARNPPLEHLLGGNNGEYRIRCRFGTSAEYRERDYRITFADLRFVEVEPSGEADELYWASDLEDFLEGRCDEFSTFCRHPLPAAALRLWRTLGLPYLNNDLIEKKLRLHFERARRGESLEEWVLPFYRFLGARS